MAPTMRVALYARYSTDLQRETSLEDQLRVCREFAERQGWQVLPGHVYTDAALTGAESAASTVFGATGVWLQTPADARPRPTTRAEFLRNERDITRSSCLFRRRQGFQEPYGKVTSR